MAVYQSWLRHISATKSRWKLKFDKELIILIYAVKEKHIQNLTSPAVILIFALKNQPFDNMGKVQRSIFQLIGGVIFFCNKFMYSI